MRGPAPQCPVGAELGKAHGVCQCSSAGLRVTRFLLRTTGGPHHAPPISEPLKMESHRCASPRPCGLAGGAAGPHLKLLSVLLRPGLACSWAEFMLWQQRSSLSARQGQLPDTVSSCP